LDLKDPISHMRPPLALFGLLVAVGGMGLAQPAETPVDGPWVLPDVDFPGVQRVIFHSEAVAGPVSCYVFTPPQYRAEPERRFPMMIWLHGGGTAERQAAPGQLPGSAQGVGALSRYFGRAMQDQAIPPMIIVFPNGRHSLWVDSKDGALRGESMVVTDLIPHIDRTFRTLARREGRLIEGWSAGGYGAARFGFKYPDLFGSVSLLGAGPLQKVFTQAPRVGQRGRQVVLERVYGGDMAYFIAQSPWVLADQQAEVLKSNLRIRMVIGVDDEMIAINRDFHAHLTSLGIPHTYTELPGVGHQSMRALIALGEDNWAFYREIFGSLESADASVTSDPATESRD